MWNERTKQDRKEIPAEFQHDQDDDQPYKRQVVLKDDTTLWDPHRPPENDYEALMQPGEERVSAETLTGNWGAYADRVQQADLSDKELAVIEYTVFGDMSLSEAGRWLGLQFREDGIAYSKTLVSKLRDSALAKLKITFTEEQNEDV